MSVLKVKKDSVWEEVGGISGHTHTTTDITNFPSSLPADGGNADTVDGKHASDFAAATDMTTAQSDISDLQSKVGDLSGLNTVDKSSLVAAINEAVDSTLTQSGQAADAAAVGNRFAALSEEISSYIKTPSKAEVGQIIRVSAVDNNGKPTEFEPYSLKIDVDTTSVNYWIQYEEIPAKTMKTLESMRILDPPPGAEYFIAKNSGIGRFPMLLFVTETRKDGGGNHFVSADVYNLGNEDVTLFEEELTIFPVYVKIAE